MDDRYRQGETEDRTLVERCCRGDQSAWEEFVRRYAPVIHGVVRHTFVAFQAGQWIEEIEDVGQEVLLKLLSNNARALRAFQWRSSLKTWLATVASTTAVDHLRKRHSKEHFRMTLDDIPAKSGGVDTTWEPSDIEALQKGIDLLLPRDGLLIKLAYERGWSYREIARLLGISENAVGPAISRAVERLREKCAGLRR